MAFSNKIYFYNKEYLFINKFAPQTEMLATQANKLTTKLLLPVVKYGQDVSFVNGKCVTYDDSALNHRICKFVVVYSLCTPVT